MHLRDRAEEIVRGWDRYERERGNNPVVDYDCAPGDQPANPCSRPTALTELEALRMSLPGGHAVLAHELDAHITYLRALLGERTSLDPYIRHTQGCRAAGWPADYLDQVCDAAVEHIKGLGIGWGPTVESELEEAEGSIEVDSAPEAITAAAKHLEPAVRDIAAAKAPYELRIESVDVDAYWAYWLDGSGSAARLRLNLRRARFTQVRARQFALHEILGHALQSASYGARCASEAVPWMRVLAVHAPHQVLLEGLAQALPLFVAPEDPALVARVRLDHFTQLVAAELHQMINGGTSVDECIAFARSHVPFWNDERIGDLLSDRSTNPLLRSYLWSYPAGLDWFVNLADQAGSVTVREVIRAAYRDPLTPEQLMALWPAGPAIGGPGR